MTRLVRLRQLVSSFSLPCLLQLVPPNFSLALENCEPCVPDVFHTEQQVGFVQRRPSARLDQIRKVAERCPHLKILHFYNNPDDPVDNFGFLAQFLSLTCLTLSGGRYSALSRSWKAIKNIIRFESQSLVDSLLVIGPRLSSLTLHHMEELHLGALSISVKMSLRFSLFI